MGLGLCYYKLKDYDTAIKQFDLILQKDPENYDALYNKAICLYAKDEKGECDKLLTQLIKKEKRPLTFLSQGLISLKEQKYDNGIKKFEDALSRDKDNIYAHHGRGQCLYEEGKVEDALNSYNDALNINPEYANALNSKANALDKLDRKDEALETYEKLNQIKPENAVYLLNYALCLYESDNLEKSQELLGKAEKLFEEQRNNFDEETVRSFEKNLNYLKEEFANKKQENK